MGAQHPDLVTNYRMLGKLLQDAGKLPEAEESYRGTLAMARAAFPPGHPHIGVALNDLSVIRFLRGDLDEAIALQKESLELRRKLYGTTPSPDLADSLNNTGFFLTKQERYAEAEPLFRESVAMKRALKGNENSNTVLQINALALCLDSLGRWNEAEPLHLEVLAARRKAFPAGHPDIAKSAQAAGDDARRLGRFADAIPLLREALAIREKALPAGDWAIDWTRATLGAALGAAPGSDTHEPGAEGGPGEAETLMLAGWQGLKANPTAPDSNRHEALANIATFYEAHGRPERAAEVRRDADAAAPVPANAVKP
jgi:tetratricopeptide (TPR) repeat protein